MSNRRGHHPDDIRADLAYAIGEGLDQLAYLRQQSRVSQGGRDV